MLCANKPLSLCPSQIVHTQEYARLQKSSLLLKIIGLPYVLHTYNLWSGIMFYSTKI